MRNGEFQLGDQFYISRKYDVVFFQIVDKRYKTGFKYKLKVISESGSWSTNYDWLTAKEITKYFKRSSLGRLLYA